MMPSLKHTNGDNTVSLDHSIERLQEPTSMQIIPLNAAASGEANAVRTKFLSRTGTEHSGKNRALMHSQVAVWFELHLNSAETISTCASGYTFSSRHNPAS